MKELTFTNVDQGFENSRLKKIFYPLFIAGILFFNGDAVCSENIHHYEIPAQSLNNALVKFAAQSNLELIFTADKIRGLKAKALSGQMTETQALEQLLSGSGYSYRFLDSRTVTLIPDSKSILPEQQSANDVPKQLKNLKILRPMLVFGHETGSSSSQESYRKTYRVTHSSSATRTETPIHEIPQSIQVIPRTLFNDQQNLTISESLRNVSGVTIRPAISTPSFDFTLIRGFKAEQMLDGFTQYYNPGDRESLVNVESIEVLKGPNALLYSGGSGTPAGGLVNIVSKLPKQEAFYQAGFKYGSYQYYQPWIDLNQPLTDWLRFRLTGEFTSAESHIDVIETERFNINPSLILTNNINTSLTLQGKISHWEQPDYQGLPATGTIGGDFSVRPQTFIGPKDIEPSRSEFHGVWATLEHFFDDTWSASLKARYAESIFDQKTQLLFGADGIQADLPLITPSTWSLFNSELYQKQQEFSVVGNVLAQFEAGPLVNKLLLGADYSRYQDDGFIETNMLPVGVVDLKTPVFTNPYHDPGSGENNVFVTNITYGAYLQLQTTLYQRLHFLGGLRLGHITINYLNNDSDFEASAKTETTKILPRVGASFEINDDFSAFVGYSQAMRGQPFINFSTAPSPELSDNLETGFKFDFNSQLSGQVAIYRIDREQIAVADNSDSQGRSVSTGKMRSQGMEADLLWQSWENLSIKASYAYTDTKFLNDHPGFPKDSPVAGIARHSGRFWVNYRFLQWPFTGLSLGAGIYAQSGAPLNVPGISRSKGFYSLDAALNYQTEHARFSLSAKNLTNEQNFEFFEYLGGRTAPTQPISIFFAFSFRY